MTDPVACLRRNWLALCMLACGAPAAAQSAADLGESKRAAIEVCRPAGQRAYLSRLVCPDGSTPGFRRVGNHGPRNDVPANMSEADQKKLTDRLVNGTPLQPGETDYHIIDAYEIDCGAEKRLVYLDMYHCNQPAPIAAPRGFTLRPE